MNVPPALAPHQNEAIAAALERLKRLRGVLLADDVGLGKSYVAAELLRRSGAECEVIVPAALVEQWRETLALFDVDARILTHDAIVREPFVARAAERLVVVDEAHAFRNPQTLRYAALARRTVGARVLLVTATPVCNSLCDLGALVRLIVRDDVLAPAGVPSIDFAFESRDRELIARVVASLVIRRDRSVLPPELELGALERRVVLHDVPPLTQIDALEFPLVGDHAIVRQFLWRRLESSEAALAESVRRQLRFYDRALACLASGRELPKRDYRRAFAHEEDREAFQEILFWELFAPAGARCDADAIRREIDRLHELQHELDAIAPAKREVLLEIVRKEREPMLVFTSAAATARDLAAAIRPLRSCGLVTSRERTRDAVLDAFRRGLIDVVVSTDMTAEGLNLQRAGTVVHYDIPWNPVRLDQRNGRAYRIGQQRATVRAIYFVPRSRQTTIVETISRKNRLRRRTLSPAPSPVVVSPPTLVPRLTAGAAWARLSAAALCAGLELPPFLARRHKAGIEQLMGEMAGEFLDRYRLDELVALVRLELGAE